MEWDNTKAIAAYIGGVCAIGVAMFVTFALALWIADGALWGLLLGFAFVLIELLAIGPILDIAEHRKGKIVERR